MAQGSFLINSFKITSRFKVSHCSLPLIFVVAMV